jgi:glycopeptide antibiotics resistance protein
MTQYVIRDILASMIYLPYAIIGGIILYFILQRINLRLEQKKKKRIPAVSYSLFLSYLFVILSLTLLSREQGSRGSEVDLVFFSSMGINARNNAYVAENVLLFIPYGFLMPLTFARTKNFFVSTVCFFLTSLSIECLQLLTHRGYFQVDDILTNVIGAWIGLFFFYGASILLRFVRKLWKSSPAA